MSNVTHLRTQDHALLADRATYTLQLADDALILSHRLAEWITSAPEIEEDVALANISLDLLGQARMLLTYAGALEGGLSGSVRTEGDLAYLRDERAFSNCLLVEQPNGDFAATIARQLVFATYQVELYSRLEASADATIAAVAAKAVKEVRYHRDHATVWTLRLGDGTATSHDRMQAGVDRSWPYAAELFETGDAVQRLVNASIAADPAVMLPAWHEYVTGVLTEATLAVPPATDPNIPGFRPRSGGRTGTHTEGFGYLLAEMQYVHRSFPGAQW
jgi:ring-1,2-phenylacetyl-CoA epoxidase subunit PaaC